MINIPRGLTVLVNGEFIPSEGKLEFDGIETEVDFGLSESKSAAYKGFNVRNYEQHFQVSDTSCGRDCTPLKLEYEEYFRMDVADPTTGSKRRFFHRGKSYLDKESTSTVPLFD